MARDRAVEPTRPEEYRSEADVGKRADLVVPSTSGLPTGARTSLVTTLVIEVAYFVTNALLWAYGFLAYYRNFGGLVRFLGALYLPVLALPVVGRGEIGGHDVRSVLWVAWFALEVGLGLAVVLVRLPPSAEAEVVKFPGRASGSSSPGPASAEAAASNDR